MKKLSLPQVSYNDMLNKCSQGIKQVKARDNFISAFQNFYEKESEYRELSIDGNLYNYPKIEPLNNETIVIGNLTKSKLINLYENNLRNKNKPAREYFDLLLLSSGGLCPFCGNIGHSKNLDHFLPKTHFPEFSIMPLNLVPSCRDCNMGEKGQTYATSEDEQIIHPYLDKNIFYQEQWVFAEYIDDINENYGVLSYYVHCPDNWREEDKKRAEKHFNSFNLANRYRLEAGKHLSEVIDLKNSFIKTLSSRCNDNNVEKIKDEIVKTILEPVINSDEFPNHWKKVMYKCLAKSTFFNK